MMIRTALLLLLGSAVAVAGEGERSIMLRVSDAQAMMLTGNMRVDLCGLRSLDAVPIVQQSGQPGGSGPSRKSPWLAAGLSLVVPGAGEFYAKSYWKSAAFFAVEVAALALAYQYDRRGDQQTDDFQHFADQHWNVVQYGQFTADHTNGGNYAWLIPNTEGLPPWQRVNWSELNRMERDMGGYYSHTLPPYGEQQYYELIGKYPQFNQGWDDANLSLPSNYDVIKANLTPRYLYYANERGKANSYYDKASTFMVVVLVNHVASALDAAWSAASYNKDLSARMDVMTIPVGQSFETVPAVRVAWRL